MADENLEERIREILTSRSSGINFKTLPDFQSDLHAALARDKSNVLRLTAIAENDADSKELEKHVTYRLPLSDKYPAKLTLDIPVLMFEDSPNPQNLILFVHYKTPELLEVYIQRPEIQEQCDVCE